MSAVRGIWVITAFGFMPDGSCKLIQFPMVSEGEETAKAHGYKRWAEQVESPEKPRVLALGPYWNALATEQPA